MRIRYVFRMIFFSLLAVACDEREPSKSDKGDFAPGDILVGIKSTIPISSVFDLMNEKEVFIEQMNGFYDYSTLPNDSLDYIKNILKSKSYIDKGGDKSGSAFLSASDNRIIVTASFFQMNISAQKDWLSTIDQLQLKDLGNDTQHLLIKVSHGTEQQWMDIFKEHPYVTWVELNYIGGFEPL